MSAFDTRGLLASRVWLGGPTARVEVTRDANGWATSLSRFADGAGTVSAGTTSLTRDGRGAVTAMTHRRADGSVVAGYGYTYDVAGQLVNETRSGGNDAAYAYDSRGQLTGADRDGSGVDEGYGYDANGNRVGGDVVTGVGDRLLEDSQYRYQYDNEGNRTRRENKATGEVEVFEWDHRNRLVGVTRTSSGGIVLSESRFTYDVQDRLIVRTVDGQSMVTVYEGQDVWADYTLDGDVLTRYLHGDEVDEVLARWRPAEGLAWHLADRQGTVRDIVDSAGVVLNHVEYDSFGRVLAQTNEAAGDRFLFTGREYEASLGLYWYRARWYDPAVGRFVSVDPMGFDAGDANLYRYVGNSPVMGTDPSGMFTRGLLRKVLAVLIATAPASQGNPGNTPMPGRPVPPVSAGIAPRVQAPPKTPMGAYAKNAGKTRKTKGGGTEYAIMVQQGPTAQVLASAGQQSVTQVVQSGGSVVGAQFSGWALALSARMSNVMALTAVVSTYGPGFLQQLQVAYNGVQRLWSMSQSTSQTAPQVLQQVQQATTNVNVNVNAPSTGGPNTPGGPGDPKDPTDPDRDTDPCDELGLTTAAPHIISQPTIRLHRDPNPNHPAFVDFRVVHTVVARLRQATTGTYTTAHTTDNITGIVHSTPVNPATGNRYRIRIGNHRGDSAGHIIPRDLGGQGVMDGSSSAGSGNLFPQALASNNERYEQFQRNRMTPLVNANPGKVCMVATLFYPNYFALLYDFDAWLEGAPFRPGRPWFYFVALWSEGRFLAGFPDFNI